MPLSCAASSASAIWVAMMIASRHGSRRPAIRSASVSTFHQLQDQVPRLTGFNQVMNPGDVYVLERRQSLRFSTEPLDAIGIIREGLG